MLTGKSIKSLLIVLTSLAIVALGTQEFVSRHKHVSSQLEMERVQKLAQGLRGQNNFERASFSPDAYQQMLERAGSEEPQESGLSLRIKKAKSWLANKLASNDDVKKSDQ